RQRHHHDEHEADRRYRTALVRLLLADRAGRVDDLDRQAIDLNELSHWLRRSDIPARTARTILVSLKELADGGRMALWDDDSFGKLARVVADLVDFRRLYVFAKQRAGDLREWNDAYRLGLTQYLD